MGSFNISCALSGLTMYGEDEALMFLIGIPIKEQHHDSGTIFPADPAQAVSYNFLEGKYYDYGRLEFNPSSKQKSAVKDFNQFTGYSTLKDYNKIDDDFRECKFVHESFVLQTKLAIHPMYIRKDVFQVALDAALYDEEKAIKFLDDVVIPELDIQRNICLNGTEAEKMRAFFMDYYDRSEYRKTYYKIYGFSAPMPCYVRAYMWGWNFDSYNPYLPATGIRNALRAYAHGECTKKELQVEFLAIAKYIALLNYMRLMNCCFRMSCYAGQEYENKEQAKILESLAKIGNTPREWDEEEEE